ncbi:unnamed protein product [Ambrosiozyma monospora]|uniref:Unnamed protein product n=1 Tax=Ambrosiozyma monospora TaxID=43982 RepID=A0ACB5T3F9_AMBMO|nr:unnamed protein product [Ambrosiozyma monospora]
MLSYGDLSLRTINFIFLVIILGLSGSLAATTNTQHNPQVNFVVFAAAWGLLTSTFYGIAANFFSFLASPLFLTITDFLNTVFTFAGATALAVAIRCHSCTNDSYVNKNKVAQGDKNRCRKSQATVAFTYFSFFVFLFSLAISAISITKNGLLGYNSRPKVARTGVPTMSQV